jgi:hypothetical protein
MHFIYLDESGNTGCNLKDEQQPIFLLCALLVPESRWQGLERSLQAVTDELLGRNLPDRFEVHASELRTGRGFFKETSLPVRLALRDRWLAVAGEEELRVIYRAIEKHRFAQWLNSTFGPGVAINPHVAAFPLVARVVDEYLSQQPNRPLGTFISDDNVEVAPDLEKSLRLLRGVEGALRLERIIEKGFFIDSHKSLPLQLCDLCALTLRKLEEQKLGRSLKPMDADAIPLVEPLVHHGNERLTDVIRWLTDERKRGATRD